MASIVCAVSWISNSSIKPMYMTACSVYNSDYLTKSLKMAWMWYKHFLGGGLAATNTNRPNSLQELDGSKQLLAALSTYMYK